MRPGAREERTWRRARARRPSPWARAGRSPSDHTRQARVWRGARNAPALGQRLAVDLLDVSGECDRLRGADRHADTVRMDRTFRGLELADSRGVETTRDEDADVVEAGQVESGADLLDQIDGDAAALARRVEADTSQSLAERRGDAQRLLGLVLEGVDQ